MLKAFDVSKREIVDYAEGCDAQEILGHIEDGAQELNKVRDAA